MLDKDFLKLAGVAVLYWILGMWMLLKGGEF